ncbi:unnamed protein product [Larinioides sclopetarius]|uniref:Uncharacterized protein n=1 Tax=Larinioides sclopetarius TaxID=280406 RepID=A0AAV2APE4_9ARAC
MKAITKKVVSFSTSKFLTTILMIHQR